MRRNTTHLTSFLLLLAGPLLCAQPIITAPRPTSTNQPDPLAAFMISQPPIDTTSPIVATAEFEPNRINLGQSAVYRVTLNVMEQSVAWPATIPTPEECTMRQGASGQYLQTVGGTIVPHTTFLYHLRPRTNGTLTLPAYTVRARSQTVMIPAATLTVAHGGTNVVENAPRIELSADDNEFFVGEDIEMRARYAGLPDGTVRVLTQIDIEGENLIVDRNFRSQRIESRLENGVRKPIFTYNALVTPMRPGHTKVIAKGFTVGNQFQDQLVISGNTLPQNLPPTYTLVDSEPLPLTVLPLPHESQLPGFTGGIGTFTVDPPTLSTNRVQAGDLITMTVTLRGNGNLERVLPPEIPSQPQWQVFQPTKENTLAAIIRQLGFIKFEYKLIPLDDAINATPSIPFSYFDPDTRQYMDLTIAPIPIQVEPSPFAGSVTGQPSLIEARSRLQKLLKQPEEPTALAPTLDSPGRTAQRLTPAHQQAWFAIAQLLPAALLGGLWFWDRRRRFLEQHPQVVVRRRARKAIRRHTRRARQAARRSDAREFLHHAIQGFREACAPSAPADPRALVCDDILKALPADLKDDATKHVVTKLFTAANEWQFGEAPPNHPELLDLAHEMNKQLITLRARL